MIIAGHLIVGVNMKKRFENYVCIRHKYLHQMATKVCPDCVEEQALMDEAYFLIQAYNDGDEEE